MKRNSPGQSEPMNPFTATLRTPISKSNLKLPRRRPAALAALLSIAFLMSLSLGACSRQDKDLAPSLEQLIPYRKGKKWGFSDVNKKLVIEPKYDSAEPFSDGLARVEVKGRIGFIDKKGNEVIPVQYRVPINFGFFSDGLAEVALEGNYGYIDRNGTVVIPFKYLRALPFSEGLAGVCISQSFKCGYINKSGIEVTPQKYTETAKFSEGLARVSLYDQKSKWGFIDKNGKEVIPIKYDDAKSFAGGLAAVKLNNKWGYIDKNGTVVIPLKYDGAKSFSEDLAIVGRSVSTRSGDNTIQIVTNWGYIDKKETEVIPIGKYFGVSSFSEGLAGVILDGKLGYIDKNGVEVIPFKYEVDAGNPFSPPGNELIGGYFSDGLAFVRVKYSRWGYIDKSGKEVIPFKYDEAGSFSQGLAAVKLKDEIGYIGRDGTEYFER